MESNASKPERAIIAVYCKADSGGLGVAATMSLRADRDHCEFHPDYTKQVMLIKMVQAAGKRVRRLVVPFSTINYWELAVEE